MRQPTSTTYLYDDGTVLFYRILEKHYMGTWVSNAMTLKACGHHSRQHMIQGTPFVRHLARDAVYFSSSSGLVLTTAIQREGTTSAATPPRRSVDPAEPQKPTSCLVPVNQHWWLFGNLTDC